MIKVLDFFTVKYGYKCVLILFYANVTDISNEVKLSVILLKTKI